MKGLETGYQVVTGEPFWGRERAALEAFLQGQGLKYEEPVEFSVVLIREGEMIATGSLDKNVIKCVAVREDCRGLGLLPAVMTELINRLYIRGETRYFVYTKPENRRLFGSMGLYEVASTDRVLLMENQKDGFSHYLQQLKEETAAQGAPCDMTSFDYEPKGGVGEVGAVVVNCNPFTLGHRYLIEQAAAECSWLHVFVLSTKQGWLTPEDRFRMVQLGIQDVKNVILHGTSDYLVSPAVFPAYFLRDKEKAFTVNCELDILLFCGYIAKSLRIQRRYVGTEPLNPIAAQYNAILKETLPQWGMTFEEVNRLEQGGSPISASRVREAYERGKLEDCIGLVPDTTIAYLKKKGKFNGRWAAGDTV